MTRTVYDLAALWARVANGALAEVGAGDPWDVSPEGVVSTWGTTRAHYRSAVLAQLAVELPRPDGHPLNRPGHVVCWACWDRHELHLCHETPTRDALAFTPCARWSS